MYFNITITHKGNTYRIKGYGPGSVSVDRNGNGWRSFPDVEQAKTYIYTN